MRENYLSVLGEISEMGPEILVLTGDIGLDIGNREIYQWVRHTLDETGVEYVVLPGNHDVPELVAEVFGPALGELSGPLRRSHRVIEKAGEELLLFDVAGGTVTTEDLTWLERALRESSRDELLLFMHYPPVALPISHMERHYALEGRERVSALLEQAAPRVYLFCGHYHNELTQEGAGYSCFLTPSTYFQIDPMTEEFAVDHQQPAWRFIKRYNGSITTGVRYRGL